MAKNQDQLTAAALHEIGVLVAGQTPSAEDALIVLGRAYTLIPDLAARRVAPYLDVNAIPEALFPDLVLVLAEHIRPAYGAQPNIEARRGAEARLRELSRLDRQQNASALTKAVLELLEANGASTDTFDAAAVAPHIARALDDLSRRRIITFANEAAVTSGAFPAIAILAAWRCLPKAFDVALVADAEQRLQAMARLDRGQDPFVLMVMEQLQVYAGPAAMDGLAVTGRVPDILGELGRRGVINYATDITDLDESCRPDLARYIAASLCAPPLYAVMSMAEARLRSAAVTSRDDEPIRACYF